MFTSKGLFVFYSPSTHASKQVRLLRAPDPTKANHPLLASPVAPEKAKKQK